METSRTAEMYQDSKDHLLSEITKSETERLLGPNLQRLSGSDFSISREDARPIAESVLQYLSNRGLMAVELNYDQIQETLDVITAYMDLESREVSIATAVAKTLDICLQSKIIELKDLKED